MNFPKETHSDNEEDKLPPLATASDALGPLSEIEPTKEKHDFVQIVSSKDSLKRILVRDHYKFDLKEENLEEIKGDKPVHTIRRTADMKHYEKHRPITIREMALLQSLDIDFKLPGKKTHQESGIGNAVPVNMAKAVALTIYGMYKNFHGTLETLYNK